MSPYDDEKVQHALEFFKQWAAFTKEALAIVAPKCPTTPQFKRAGKTVHKARKWADPDGPVGLLLHYTAGPDGIASMRWGNENPANDGSSWHCTVLDHRIAALEVLRQAYPLVARYLPVTAFLHADIHWGTWHGNWTNDRTFGLENRNLGYLSCRNGQYGRSFRRRDGSSGFRPIADQRRVATIRNRFWEIYTREQLIANINIGKMLRAWRGCAFDPTWVLPHSAVWWGKSDVGPAYPMELIRRVIFADVEAAGLPWLGGYPSAGTVNYHEDDDGETGAVRHDAGLVNVFNEACVPLPAQDFDKIDGPGWREYLPALRDNMRILGYHVPHAEAQFDEKQLEPELRWATRIFQMSTHSPSFKKKPLTVDGIPGGETRTAIEARLNGFGWDV